MKREYILAPDSFVQPSKGRRMREVMERAGAGPWTVRLVVSNDEAEEVLAAIRRAYRDGRDDHVTISGSVMNALEEK